MIIRIIVCLLISVFCRAQTPGKTVVFKVRAEATSCTIESKMPYFLLEMNNEVVIKVKGRNKNINVKVTGGRIMSSQGETYLIRCVKPGSAVVAVYQNTPTGSKLLATKMFVIKDPVIYFCGIKMDSTSRFLKLTGTNFYAYSEHYKQIMPVISFDMYYVDDTTAKKIVPVDMKSDTCMLSPDMRKRILSFQPHHNYIYFHNIICRVPDGSKRILDPIEFNVIQDTTNKKSLTLSYSVRKKKL